MKAASALIAPLFLSACVTMGGVETLEIHDKSRIKIGTEVINAEKLPAPTVLVLHGCGGVDSHHREWARQLQAWGYNAVIVDSFKPRYVASACEKLTAVTGLQRAIDAHHVAKWAKQQEWSTKKVGAIGFSHGGNTVLHIVTKEDALREIGEAHIDSAAAFYPYCASMYFFSTRAIPTQIHIGTSDNWTPAGLCPGLAREWKMQDNYFEYQGAHHGFDRIGQDFTVQGQDGGMVISTKILRYDPESNKLARQRVKDFFDLTLR